MSSTRVGQPWIGVWQLWRVPLIVMHELNFSLPAVNSLCSPCLQQHRALALPNRAGSRRGSAAATCGAQVVRCWAHESSRVMLECGQMQLMSGVNKSVHSSCECKNGELVNRERVISTPIGIILA